MTLSHKPMLGRRVPKPKINTNTRKDMGEKEHPLYSFLLAPSRNKDSVPSLFVLQPHLSQAICHPCPVTRQCVLEMTSAVGLFKAVAESLVMTMLLQILIQHLEVNAAPVGNAEAPLETSQQIQLMMEELQTQRAMSEKFTLQPSKSTSASPHMGQLPQKVVSKTKAPPAGFFQVPVASSGSLAKASVNQAKAPPMSWWFSESDEDVLVLEAEESMTNSQIEGQSSSHPDPQPATMKSPFEEWGRRLITWGKKHKDHSYKQVMCQDLGYFEWCQ